MNEINEKIADIAISTLNVIYGIKDRVSSVWYSLTCSRNRNGTTMSYYIIKE